jgi:hypothetical protein
MKVYELKISPKLNDDSEVDYIALVDEPAVEKDFLAFRDQFVNPNKGERKDDFLPRCIAYVVNEGKDSEQAVAICNSIWENHFAAEKISIDYDGVLSTDKGKELAKRLIGAGNDVYIISARNDNEGMKGVAESLGINLNRVIATGSNTEKIKKIQELGISKHYDNNANVIKQLGKIGEQFNFQFKIVNEDQRIISGVLMLADKLIYRNNEKFGEHYVKFSADTIKQIAIKFAKKGFQSNVNLMHDPEQRVSGVTMFESFIVDNERGIKPMQGFEDVTNGSWFGSFYVDNAEIWDKIKSGEFRGFSVEGLFDYTEPVSVEQNKLNELKNILNEINDYDEAFNRIKELLMK